MFKHTRFQLHLQVIEDVVHSQEALQLLILGRDYGCALNLLDDLQSQCDEKDLSKIHCLRHLPDNISASLSSITDAIVVDFMEVMRWRKAHAVVRMTATPMLDSCGMVCKNCDALQYLWLKSIRWQLMIQHFEHRQVQIRKINRQCSCAAI